MSSAPAYPFRVPLAREYLRQRFAMNAGIDPGSGFSLHAKFDDSADESTDERTNRLEYLETFRARAVSEISGLIEGCHLRVWRSRDGGLEMAAPVWAAQSFFERNGETDDFYIEAVEWDSIFAVRYPETELARRWQDDDVPPERALEAEQKGPWPEAKMKAAIKDCEVANRDTAWRIVFGPRRDDHGWDVNSFRQIWSEARGTKGATGRPPKRAK